MEEEKIIQICMDSNGFISAFLTNKGRVFEGGNGANMEEVPFQELLKKS